MVKNASPILAALRNASQSEAAAVEFVEQHRWKGTPACPRCGSLNVYKMKSADGSRNKDYRLRCKDCPRGKQMFTVRTATVFEESRLPLRVWVFAFWRACASKKGISALQLSREMEITHKSALFVLRRIRHGMGVVPADASKLTGTVEADETYIGGRLIRGSQRGRANVDASHKTPVLGMVQRGGNVRLRMMERLTAKKLGQHLIENADLTCRLVTDEFRSYEGPGTAFAGGHGTVNHSANEYVRGGDHTNTIEGVFSLIKRGVMGTFHSVTRKHLPNYLNEFEFRWNTRKLNDGDRIAAALRALEGKRLEYRQSVDNPPYLVNFTPQPRQAGAGF
jgi:transposase-like protein